MTRYCQVDLYFRAQITKKIRMSKFSPRKIVFRLCFFLASCPRSIGMPAFCGSKRREVHTMVGRSGWG